MKHEERPYRIPLLTACGLILALGIWVSLSWQGYTERAQEWQRQRAQETFDTLNAVIAAMSYGEMTDWRQVQTALGTIIRGSRTLFVVVQGQYGRLVQTGSPPDFLFTNSTQGEQFSDTTHTFWAPLRPIQIPKSWSEALDYPHMGLGLWPKSNPIMYLGFQTSRENVTSSRFWERQAPIFLSALVCVLAVTAVWIAGIRRRALAGQLAAERARSAHLEELGLAAAGLAHETKNPLGIIMGMAQQIANRPDIPAESRIMLEHILDEVDKASSRLGNFMSFAKPHAPVLVPTDLAALGMELEEILGPDFEGNSVRLQIQVPRTRILADATMLRQILVNLLLNSLHASRPGTTVFIALVRHGRRVSLQVRDQGCGIHPELITEIFKPYTSGSATGHGLGLAIVKRLVEAQKWRIHAASSPGQGTTMTISGVKLAPEQT